MSDQELYCKNLPKVELHAHLNGSLSASTIEELKTLKNSLTTSSSTSSVFQPTENSLSSCFNAFSQLHDLVCSKEAIVLATKRVIEDFSADQVKYLELRSTPKEIVYGDTRVSKVEYIECILHSIRESTDDTIVKFLVSVDRARSVQDALENVQLACQFSKQSDIVVGVDLSGNPNVGDARDFIPALQYAKREGLSIAAHLAEVPNQNEETLAILESVTPGRIGHGNYIHTSKGGSKAGEEYVIANKIPLELCLTSNVRSGTVPSYDEHHFKVWHEINHPFVLCTDDKGLFNSPLSNEYCLFQKYSGVRDDDLFNLSRNSLEYIFSKSSKEILTKNWNTFQK